MKYRAIKYQVLYSIFILTVITFSFAVIFSFTMGTHSSTSIGIDDYLNLLSTLDSEKLGRGKDVLSEQEKDRPMAYGLILSSLANSYKAMADDDIYTVEMRLCGEWLLGNTDIDGDGIHGFGLADAWDAFGDGSVNPPHNEYTITTAIAVKGLLDWLDADPDAPQEKIKSTVSLLLAPYLSGQYNSPSGIYAYSLNSNDIAYDVFNPALFLAGQMQRYSKITENDTEILKNEADRNVKILVDNHLLDSNSNWYWNYGQSLEKLERPNDLVHALYIAEGVRDYINHNGSNADKIDYPRIRNHVFAFLIDGRWCEHFDRGTCHEKKVRLWAMGMLLYFLSTEPDIPSKYMDSLLDQLIADYKVEGGLLKDENQYVRHDAHLLLGISHYLFSN